MHSETSLHHIMSCLEREITWAFMGGHKEKFHVGQRVGFEGRQRDGAVHEAVDIIVTNHILLARFSSLGSETQASFLRHCDSLFREHGENTTIELVVDWGLMEERVIKIEKEIYRNKSFLITLTLI